MAKETPRVAVAERGVALLALIAASDNGVMFLAQDEGADIVTAGQAEIDATVTAPAGLAAVKLTEAGQAAVKEAAAAAEAAKPKAKVSFEIETGIEIPSGKSQGNRQGRESIYPFAQLEVGQSFHVPKTAANPEPAVRLGSSVSGARVQFSVDKKDEAGNVVNETVTVKTYAKDDKGAFVKGVDGKRVQTGTQSVTRPVKVLTRDFVVKTVGADDPKGEGARVWRVALES